MKAILYAISIVLIAAGVAVGLMVLTNAANVVIGLTLETAAILISGGFVMLGLASVTAALFAVVDAIEAARRPASAGAQLPERAHIPPAATAAAATTAAAAGSAAWAASGDGRGAQTVDADAQPSWRPAVHEPAGEPAAESPASGPEAVEPEPGEPREEAAADAVEISEETVVAASPDHAGDLMDRAFAASEAPPDEDLPPAGEADVLYIVEETVVLGRPARVLSDGTVEAETDEGWMRFENMEHLEEYFDATRAA